MRKIFDVKCPQGHRTEVFGNLEDTFRCGECGEDAKRVITPIRFKLDGTSGHFPTAADKWAKRHIQGAKRGDNDE